MVVSGVSGEAEARGRKAGGGGRGPNQGSDSWSEREKQMRETGRKKGQNLVADWMWGRGNFSAIQGKNAASLLLLTSAQWQEWISDKALA